MAHLQKSAFGAQDLEDCESRQWNDADARHDPSDADGPAGVLVLPVCDGCVAEECVKQDHLQRKVV